MQPQPSSLIDDKIPSNKRVESPRGRENDLRDEFDFNIDHLKYNPPEKQNLDVKWLYVGNLPTLETHETLLSYFKMLGYDAVNS